VEQVLVVLAEMSRLRIGFHWFLRYLTTLYQLHILVIMVLNDKIK